MLPVKVCNLDCLVECSGTENIYFAHIKLGLGDYLN